jgi:hypothetical protein
MRAWCWLFVAAAGWGVMLAAYATRARPDPKASWAHTVLVIGPDLPTELADVGPTTKVKVRLLPAGEQTEAIIRGVSLAQRELALKFALELRSKLFLVPADGAKVDASSLQSGRLPEAGRDEVIAGASAVHCDRLTVGDRDLEVVGVLKPGPGPLRDSYLIPASETADGLFSEFDPSVREATLVHLSGEPLSHNRKILQKLQKGLPAATYTLAIPLDWVEPQATYLYLAGLAVFLLGGSGAIIGAFRALGTWTRRTLVAPDQDRPHGPSEQSPMKRRPSWWTAPLLEMEARPRLVWGVHLAYFGLVIVGSLLVSRLPEVQTILTSNVREALAASSGPLALAARAYESGNILRAAAVTFVINFFLGSLLVLTLPSVIIPGSGILMATIRALTWGLLFSPTIGELQYGMLAHSGTMLLEGEGYILATLFGLLIPIHIFQSSLGGTPLSRFGRVIWLNVLANFWVAAVLIIAAGYEATEVIWMSR